MLQRFRQLSRFVADEAHPDNQGLRISPQVQGAFQEMLRIYEGVMLPWLSNAPQAEVVSHMDTYEFVQDYIRTIYMIRAMNRLILHKQSERLCGGRFRKVKVTEAGCGSGFLTGVALALSDRVSVQAFDYHPTAIKATKMWVAALGKERQAQVTQRDLLKPCFDVETDILVAEHLALGLKGEHCVQIPRNFKVDPLFTVPYAVIPAIHWDSAWNNAGVVKGHPIIIADQKGREYFDVRGKLPLAPKLQLPINVGADVLWGCRYDEYASLHQKLDPKYEFWPGMINYLLKVHSLIDPADRSQAIGVKNHSNAWREAEYQLSYPVGRGFDTPVSFMASGEGIAAAPYKHSYACFHDPYNYGMLRARLCD